MKMPIELEDQKWFPNYLRQMQTEYIGWLVSVLGIYNYLVPIMKDFHSQKALIDLCSGSGAPAKYLAEKLRQPDLKWTLTDLYPPVGINLPNELTYEPKPYHVLEQLAIPHTRYTMFNAFHHFSPPERARIINTFSSSGLLVVEILQPNVFDVIKILFATTIGQILLAPFVKPFRWDRLLFTWLIPINLLTISWDGVVSVLKSVPYHKFKAEFQNHVPHGVKSSTSRTGPFYARIFVGIAIPIDE